MTVKGKTFAVNRKARFQYDILDRVEAGLVLLGTEIKAIREGHANLSDAYARPEDGELWLVNAHIAQYSAGGVDGHDPDRPRKLLLHKEQIQRLSSQVLEKRLTLVALRLYLKGHRAKVELGLARGRQQHDKRRALRDKERERDAREAVKREV
jgi:SsrA-binding protein